MTMPLLRLYVTVAAFTTALATLQQHHSNGSYSEAPDYPVTESVPHANVSLAPRDDGSFVISGSSGVPAMHAAVMADGKVMFIDKMETYTELKLPNGRYAYSSYYDPENSALTPLSVANNAFCAAGTFIADGRVLSLGGSEFIGFDDTIGNGYDAIRYLAAGDDDGWLEPGYKLSSNR